MKSRLVSSSKASKYSKDRSISKFLGQGSGLSKTFPGTLLAPTQEKAIMQAKAPYKGLSIWSDGSRLENGRAGAGIAWQDYSE
jgi:hypothetical protein